MRLADPLFTSNAVRITPEGHLSLVYKAAAEIGELGDNTRMMRDAIRSDALLRRALVADTAQVTHSRSSTQSRSRSVLIIVLPEARCSTTASTVV